MYSVLFNVDFHPVGKHLFFHLQIHYVCAHVWIHMCCAACVKVRGQFVGVSSLLLPCVLWELSYDHRLWRQTLTCWTISRAPPSGVSYVFSFLEFQLVTQLFCHYNICNYSLMVLWWLYMTQVALTSVSVRLLIMVSRSLGNTLASFEIGSHFIEQAYVELTDILLFASQCRIKDMCHHIW